MDPDLISGANEVQENGYHPKPNEDYNGIRAEEERRHACSRMSWMDGNMHKCLPSVFDWPFLVHWNCQNRERL